MNHRLPADVPKSGKRYNLTLTGSGLTKRKQELAHFVIDGDESRGVRVSLYLTPKVKQSFMELLDLESDQVSATALDARKYDLRISAIIDVERLAKNAHGHFTPVGDDYNETNVYVHYELREFAEPDADSTLVRAHEKREQKFTRKKSGKKASTPKAEPKSKAKSKGADKDANPDKKGEDQGSDSPTE